MKSLVVELHNLFNSKERFHFPFDIKKLPKNGIYILFQKGESFGGVDRIVRVGTHTGENQLRSRIKQHFIDENKNRSIFRKNIGRCFLNKENQSYLSIWELDITPKENREEKLKRIDRIYEADLEKRISAYIQENFSFYVFEVNTKETRLDWESKIISTLSNAAKNGELKVSEQWLGKDSTKDKIRESGLWQVNELYKAGLSEEEFQKLVEVVNKKQ